VLGCKEVFREPVLLVVNACIGAYQVGGTQSAGAGLEERLEVTEVRYIRLVEVHLPVKQHSATRTFRGTCNFEAGLGEIRTFLGL